MRTMLAVALLVAMSAAAEGANEARDILDQRKHLEETTRRWEDLSQKMTFRVVYRAGGTREDQIEVYERRSDGERKTIAFVVAPAEVKGTGFLAFARHPLVNDAVEVALLGDDFGLPRRIERALRIRVHALVIHPAPLRVAQHLVGVIDLDEARLGVRRLRHVRVKAPRQPAIGRLDLVRSGSIGESENAVEVFHTVAACLEKIGARPVGLRRSCCGKASLARLTSNGSFPRASIAATVRR